MDPRTDEIAREAARLIQTGRVAEIQSAIAMAAESLGYWHAPLPGQGRVRKHAQAMTMQSVGEAEYQRMRLNVWQVAEEMLSALELAAPDGRALFVGRAADGHIDAGVTIHIRLYTRTPIERIAQALVEMDYDDPTFHTAETRFGRLSQVKFIVNGVEIMVTRCMPEMQSASGRDLFRDKPVAVIDVGELRRKIRELTARQ
jgi:hypothetical protein